jgi:hypothetical protein
VVIIVNCNLEGAGFDSREISKGKVCILLPQVTVWATFPSALKRHPIFSNRTWIDRLGLEISTKNCFSINICSFNCLLCTLLKREMKKINQFTDPIFVWHHHKARYFISDVERNSSSNKQAATRLNRSTGQYLNLYFDGIVCRSAKYQWNRFYDLLKWTLDPSHNNHQFSSGCFVRANICRT